MGTPIKERGIIFSAPMVRAILEGRKSVTRRVIKPQPPCSLSVMDNGLWTYTFSEDEWKCPYGVPGDCLWVRETWQAIHATIDLETGYADDWWHPKIIPGNSQDGFWQVQYKADESWDQHIEDGGFPWRPSIHMPRWASRITLEITGVRVERLQEISDEDARAEGCYHEAVTPLGGFRVIWNSINGKKHPWESDPFVWVIEFKKI